MNTDLQAIAKERTLICTPCSGDKETIRIPTRSLLNAGLPANEEDEFFRMLDREHQSLLRASNGLDLFFRQYDLDGEPLQVGFRILSLEQAKEAHAKLLQRPGAKGLRDPMSVIPFAHGLSSSDYYASDRSAEETDGAYPVIFIDHERIAEVVDLPLGRRMAASVDDFLRQFIQDPVRFLRGDWRHFESVLSQWYPIAVE